MLKRRRCSKQKKGRPAVAASAASSRNHEPATVDAFTLHTSDKALSLLLTPYNRPPTNSSSRKLEEHLKDAETQFNAYFERDVSFPSHESKRSSGAVSATSAGPCDEFVIIADTSALNLRDKVVEVSRKCFETHLNFKKGVFKCISKHTKKELKTLEREVDALFNDLVAPTNARKDERYGDNLALAQAYYHLTYVYYNSSVQEHFHTALQFLARARKLLAGRELSPEVFMTAIRVREFSGTLCMKHERYEMAFDTLQEAVRLYARFTSENDIHDISCDLLYETREQRKISIAHRLWVIYMTVIQKLIATCSTAKFRESHKLELLEYEHTLLQLLLRTAKMNGDEKHRFVACLLSLSRVLLTFDRLREARDHIAVACLAILRKLREDEPKWDDARCIDCQFLVAYSNLIWAKYGLSLLAPSSKRLFPEDTKDIESSHAKNVKPEQAPSLLFAVVASDRKNYISPIVDESPYDYESAKKIFVGVVKCLHRTMEFANMEQNAQMITSAALLMSSAYRFFACYESLCNIQLLLYTRHASLLNYAMLWLKKDCSKAEFLMHKLIVLKKALAAICLFEFAMECKDKDEEFINVNFSDYMDARRTYMLELAEVSINQFKTYLCSLK